MFKHIFLRVIPILKQFSQGLLISVLTVAMVASCHELNAMEQDVNIDTQKIVDENIKSRHAVRAFLPIEVSKELILEILNVAKHAPSGINMQPWEVYVIIGPEKEALSDEIEKTFFDPESIKEHSEENPYYPKEWTEPYLSRRSKMGADLYGSLGVKKGDVEHMNIQHARNFRFFDAPVGIFFVIDRMLQKGSLIDIGMFMQTMMLAAKVRGLDTCTQIAFNRFHRIIAKHLNLSQDKELVCGISLGYADVTQSVNQFVTDREPAQNFTHFVGGSSKL